MALILGTALEHWVISTVIFFSISALWIVATDPLWSGPVSKTLWGFAKWTAFIGILFVALAFIIGM